MFVGIDLGTTFSAVATIDETGRPKIVHNRDGENVTPSCIEFRDDGVAEVGEVARRALFIDGSAAVGRFKRDMGTSKKFEIAGQAFSPMQLSTFVLRKLASDTIAAIGQIKEAVITIPANFSHEAREATMAAARAANLNVRYIINEPTAAALYYAFKSGDALSGVYAVYDLGGGTFDVSLIRVDGQNVEVLATNGVARLGGDDFDAALQKLVLEKFKAALGEALDESEFTRNDAEEEKRTLSKREKVSVRRAKQNVVVTRTEFEEAISSLIVQAEMLCEATLEEAAIDVGDVRGVFLVGGSTRIPAVEASVKRVFRQEPVSTVNVDEVVALGAALYAAYKGDQSALTDVQRASLGRIKVAESTGKCFGTIAAVADQIRGTPQLKNSILIKKGTPIPCAVTESYHTMREGQDMVLCHVTESTAPETDPKFVKVIWQGELKLPPGRPAFQEIQVTYAYDENQMMKCSFRDVATNRETVIDLSVTADSDSEDETIEKFIVE